MSNVVTKDRRPFWEKVQKGEPTECWPWTGYVKSSGHGLTQLDGLMIHASRKAWILTHGPIRGDFCVLHTCDNALCCNPKHMYLGSRADNMLDRWSKRDADNRAPMGRRHILDDTQLHRLWEMRRKGAKLRECAAEFGVHIATVCRYITTARKARLGKLRTKTI